MGKRSHIPALPIELDGKRLPKRSDPPEIGQHGAALLSELGYSQQEIAGLVERRIVAFPTNGGGDQ
jgi:crotonobetainyl-CoA:carnitine CoA-transferase CaiB-like acyl-CoA transferase